jgi:phospholipase C
MLVVTYDEHGGFFDHVPPPMGVPLPGDGEGSFPDAGFLFDRLGVRIPTLLVSPWIAKGRVASAPLPQQKPAANSEFELTSIITSARKLLPLLAQTPPLTKRDAWAATFESFLGELDSPRTDCPLHLPAAPPPTRTPLDEAGLPVNALQADIIAAHRSLTGATDSVLRQEHLSIPAAPPAGHSVAPLQAASRVRRRHPAVGPQGRGAGLERVVLSSSGVPAAGV